MLQLIIFGGIVIGIVLMGLLAWALCAMRARTEDLEGTR
jgi:hypothetical protein